MRRIGLFLLLMLMMSAVALAQAQQPGAPVFAPFPENEATARGFAYGARVELRGQDTTQVLARLQELGVSWAAQRVDWADIEPTAGSINFEALDALVLPLDAAGFDILLTVTEAPAWARESNLDSGPPINNDDFGFFMSQLAERYQGVVDAYEIWAEPNLRSQWTGRSISGADYMELLKRAYNAVKAADPAALVISAGLAPTATNDPNIAVNDRVFLQQMYDAGLADFSDAVGARHYGWANPADAVCCANNRPAIPAWDDQPAFFFLNSLRDYREIMNRNGDDGTFLWVTGFGWGSAEGVNSTVGEGVAFVSYTDAVEQGQYLVRALQLGRDLSYVGPMMVDNLNFCSAYATGGYECFWSLTQADGSPRPAYDYLRQAIP